LDVQAKKLSEELKVLQGSVKTIKATLDDSQSVNKKVVEEQKQLNEKKSELEKKNTDLQQQSKSQGTSRATKSGS